MTCLRLLVVLSALACTGATAAPVRTPHVEAELVASRTAVEPGTTLQAALRLKMIPYWHTYWRNPGDAGQPTSIEWALPAGYRGGEIQWPAPSRMPAGPLMNYGYEDEVLLPVDIEVPAGATGTALLKANAKWLVCNEERCVPEDGVLTLALPVGKGDASPWSGAIARTRAALPVAASALGEWKLDARGGAGKVDLSIVPPAGISPARLSYFPFEEGKVHYAGRQALSRTADGYLLEIPLAEQPVGEFTRAAGLLVADRPFAAGGPNAVVIDVPVQGAVTRVAATKAVLSPAGTAAAPATPAPSLAVAILFALAGGLILNLMPCVLPVLSIKILGFAGQSESRAMRLHGMLYAAGVLASFLLLAGVLVALKAAGSQIGWGFQLQSPTVVLVLAAMFLALALNLSGVFEFRLLLPARIADARSGNARADAFLSGVLAVAIASPCTAPFMGAALGYALSESALTAFVVFAALGIGMAAPYVALAWHPAWLKWLPRPGTWMVRLKQVLAIPLYSTVLWLAWVLSLQVGAEKPAPAADLWQPWSQVRVDRLVAADKPVFVDFTAAWCVTCQVNKKLVLQSPEVEAAFRFRGVALLRADWTRPDPEIARALASLGRNGIPVYVLYIPGRAPELLPEVLTREAVLDRLGPLPRKEPQT